MHGSSRKHLQQQLVGWLVYQAMLQRCRTTADCSDSTKHRSRMQHVAKNNNTEGINGDSTTQCPRPT
jgi:hypothetical protein